MKPIEVRPEIRARDQSFELLRLVAAFGIVLFHAGAPGSSVGFGGIVVFIVVSVAMEVGPNWERRRSLASLAGFFLVPWAIWWVGYGLINVVRGRGLLPPGPIVGTVLSGTAPHLWYLPFMCAVLIGVGAGKALLSKRAVFLGSGVIALGLLASVKWWWPWSLHQGAPWAQYCQAVPLVFAGLFLGAAMHRRATLAAGAILIVWMVAAVVVSRADIGVLLGLILTVVLLLRPLPLRWNVEKLSRCTYGVYLMHPFWLMAFAPLLGGIPLLRVTAAFGAALAATWALRRYTPSIARWVV